MGCLTAKASGNITNFISPTVTPIESAKVYFSPTQLGEGTPSPDNIREIVGRTGVELYQCGKNLLPSEITTFYRYYPNGGAFTASGSYSTFIFDVPNGTIYVKRKSGKLGGYASLCNQKPTNGVLSAKAVTFTYLSEFTLNNSDGYKYLALTVPRSFETDINQLDEWEFRVSVDGYTDYTPRNCKTIPFSWKRLPDEYQEVEYIESDGGQYIDSGIVPSTIDIYSFKGEFPNKDNSVLFGCRSSGTYRDSNQLYLNRNVDKNIKTVMLITNTANNGDTTGYAKNVFFYRGDNLPLEIDGKNISIDGRTSASFNPTQSIYLLGFNVLGTNNETVGGGKLVYFKIDGRCNFIPCYRKSDNEIGMYDTVSQTFYTNQGTGTFTKGNDVFSDEVYGGYVDLVKGEIVETYFMYTFTGEENISITAYNNNPFLFRPNTDSLIAPFGNVKSDEIYCNMLTTTESKFHYISNNCITTTANSAYSYILFRGDMFGETVESAKAKLKELYDNGTPLIVVSKIRNTVMSNFTHPLPDYLKTQLQTLKNENTFWSDADSVEIDYGLAETFDIQKAKRKIIMNQPHVETLTGDIVSFTTDMKAPLKECKVSFMPVQEGSGDPSPSNVRNITGWSGAELYQCGKNLLNPNIFTNVGYIMNGNIVADSNFKYSDLFYITKGEYVFSGTNGNSASSNVRIHLYDEDGKWIKQIGQHGVVNNRLYNISFEITDNVSYIRLSVPSNLINGQIELGSTATPYEPYQGTTYSVDWTDDTGTVYGGYVDLVSGELVATHLAFVMDGINYTVSTGGAVSATTNMARAHSFMGRTGMTDLPEGKYSTGIYASNKYVIHGLNNGSADSVIEEGVYCGTGTPYVRVVVNADNLSDVSSASAIVNSINEWLQTNPVQICYQLAEPITYQLTPQQLITLKGQNNLWADTNGTTEIKFWKH